MYRSVIFVFLSNTSLGALKSSHLCYHPLLFAPTAMKIHNIKITTVRINTVILDILHPIMTILL